MNSKEKQKVIDYLAKDIEKNDISFPVFENFWEGANFEGIEGINPEKAKAVLLFMAGRIIASNHDAPFLVNVRFQPRPLRADYLEQIIGDDYPNYLGLLTSMKIIVRGQYRRGIIATPYNVNHVFWDEAIIFRPLTYQPIIKRLKAYSKAQLNEHRPLYLDYANVIFPFTTGLLTIDKQGALNYLKKYKDTYQAKFFCSDTSPKNLLDFWNTKLPSKLIVGKKYIENISNNKHNILLDYKGRRLYSSVSMMMKPLRNYLQYNDQELCAIDLKNSQPFHFSHVLSEQFWSPQKILGSFQSLYDGIDDARNHNFFQYFKNNRQLLKSIRRIISQQPEDILLYIQKTCDGVFYDYLFERYKEQYPRWHHSRAASKIRFMDFLNFDLQYVKAPAHADYRVFREDFPNVCYIMEQLKGRRHNDIAFLLQRLEAKMILHYFSNRFDSEYPQSPLITVHDTIIILREYKEEAQRILHDTYSDILGITPKTDCGVDLNHNTAMLELNKYLDDKLCEQVKKENYHEDYFNAILQQFTNQFPIHEAVV